MTLIPEPLKRAHLYLVALDDESKLRKSREGHRDYLKEWLLDSSEQDESGNYVYEFPDPIFGCRGLMLQRRVSEWVNEERAREIISKHDLIGRCIRVYEVSEIDYDELYAANQEGIIPDEEIDSILEFSESYALVKIK